MKWTSEACANIALIKYMGKRDAVSNTPLNPSLSYLLTKAITRVELEEIFPLPFQGELVGHRDRFESQSPMTQISDVGQQRFLDFFSRLKREFGIDGNFVVRSQNNFPSDCGLASSASSFAALTMAFGQLVEFKQGRKITNMEAWSRLGSGSSCRSFFSPWSIWDEAGARAMDLGLGELKHLVVLVDDQKKQVSSSQAHGRVITSPLFVGRAERAQERLNQFISASLQLNWTSLFELAWDEFEDMHGLFESANPPFTYRTQRSYAALDRIRSFWLKCGDGPLVTMDAGPNIHLLFRADQKQILESVVQELKSEFRFWGYPL